MLESERSPRLRGLLETARGIAREVIAPNAGREDAEAVWPSDTLRALGDAGLLGLLAPIGAGGHDAGMAGLVAVTEILAHESPSTALCFAMHCVGTAVIAARATPDQTRRYLEPIAAGRHITSLALSEPGTGLHFWVPRTQLRRDDLGYVIDGTKSFVTNGGRADSYVVSATMGEPAGEGMFNVLVVDATAEGIAWRDEWRGLGMRGNSSRTARFEDVRVPRDNLLGSEGDQLWYVFEVVAPYFLMAMAGTYLGVAQAALDEARVHLTTRRHDHTGELLAASPVLAHRLGTLWTDVERTRRLVYSAAEYADADDPRALLSVFAAKIAAADSAVGVANEAMTLAGGIAYRDNSRLARLLRDARAAHIMSPTTDILRTWIGRALANLPLM